MPETARRIGLLSEEPGSVARSARTRMRPAPVVAGTARTQPARPHNVLVPTDGRRTPRDMAFALGRGLYPVMLGLRRPEEPGLVQWEDPAPRPTRPSTASRVRRARPYGPVATGSEAPPSSPNRGGAAATRLLSPVTHRIAPDSTGSEAYT